MRCERFFTHLGLATPLSGARILSGNKINKWGIQAGERMFFVCGLYDHMGVCEP
jgi:hypothetical protein